MTYFPVEVVTSPQGVKREVTRCGPVSAGIIQRKSDGKFCFVRQWRPGYGDTMWECVAGRIDAEETNREAFIREAREEAGVWPTRTWWLGTFWLTPGVTDEVCYLWYGLVEDEENEHAPLEQDEGENVVAEWFDLSGIMPLIFDCKTALAIMLAKERKLIN